MPSAENAEAENAEAENAEAENAERLYWAERDVLTEDA